MKIKSRPEDFVVEEVLENPLKDKGDYEVYLLEKKGTNTLDALRDAARRLKVSLSEFGYCGLKDRHALTKQYVSLPAGKGDEIKAKNYRLVFAGFSDAPLTPSSLKENRFRVVVRAVSSPKEIVEAEIEEVKRTGFPNYYDVQRFGSARHGKGFVALEVVKGNYKKALKLLLAVPSPYDESKVKAFRKCLERNWGKWDRCISLATAPWEKRILSFLSRRDFSKRAAKMALGMVDEKIKEFMVNSLQSFIWNQVLSEMIESKADTKVIKQRYMYGFFLFPKGKWDIGIEEIPFPSPRIRLEGELEDFYNKVLQRLGVASLQHLRTTIKGWLFKSHRRKVKIVPDVQGHCDWDKEHPGKYVWKLFFSLPPGSYATMLIRRVFWKEMF